MPNREPEDLLERAAWYRKKAEANRLIAEGATLEALRDAYNEMAKTQDILADQSEKLHRLRSGASAN